MNYLKTLLDLIFPPRCQGCYKIGKPVLCEECISKIKPSPDAVGVYEGVLKKAILKLKFKGKKALAEPLGKLMTKNVREKFDLIIPVPLHEKRLKKRGFNQSRLLAEVISRETGIPLITDVLVRIKDTKPQFDLKREERFKNIRDAFGVENSQIIKGKSILLIDDILTTGATVKECVHALKEGGAGQIHILTLSRAID